MEGDEAIQALDDGREQGGELEPQPRGDAPHDAPVLPNIDYEEQDGRHGIRQLPPNDIINDEEMLLLQDPNNREERSAISTNNTEETSNNSSQDGGNSSNSNSLLSENTERSGPSNINLSSSNSNSLLSENTEGSGPSNNNSNSNSFLSENFGDFSDFDYKLQQRVKPSEISSVCLPPLPHYNTTTLTLPVLQHSHLANVLELQMPGATVPLQVRSSAGQMVISAALRLKIKSFVYLDVE